MKYTTRLNITRRTDDVDQRIEDWHAAAVTDRCFRLTPGHRSASWRRATTTSVTVSVRLEAGSLHEAAAAAEACVRRLALPYVAVVADVGPTLRRTA